MSDCLAPAVGLDVDPHGATLTMSAVRSESRQIPGLKVHRVLLIDDVVAERELLGAWLEDTSRFVVVGEADDGPTGVKMATELQPDLVTLDMSMPGGDGIAVLREVLGTCPKSKVVVVSGFVTDDLVDSTVNLIGAAACLSKNASPSDLVEAILTVVEKRDDDFLAKSRLAAIVESSQDAIIGKKLDGKITSWNAGAQRLYGYTATEVLGKNISLLFPDENVEELPEILEQVGRGERIAHRETRRRRKDGSIVDVSLAISPILDHGGRVVGASTIARDITTRKVLDADLERQTEDLRRSNEELEQFAYIASHDLSEPLRTISGYVELLAKRYHGQIDEDADRFISRTIEGCSRMRQLIDDLLAYSGTSRTIDQLAAVDCTSVVAEVISGMALVLEESDAQIDCRPLPTVIGDRTQIERLFQNLILNAIKFARPGVAPVVEIDAEADGDSWRLSFTDNGIGIEPEYSERIFGMFQRLHNREAFPGTGIGLAICLRIVRSHHGRIWVEDHVGPGTRICVTLPVFVPVPESSSL